MNVLVRPEDDGDAGAVRAVHLVAFETEAEADLVARLREEGDSEISLVAELAGEIVGHALLSRMDVSGDGRAFRALGLGPVAVRPWAQDGGVGTALVRSALAEAQARGEELVFVVGEPDYYYRFGFTSEAAAPFDSPYAGSWFMALWLRRDAAAPASGSAAYAPAFAALDESE
ncbi:MAG TPA: N-acetyltransferase [Allosphingosinicella sp.]|nr:N-acetyltransferase [Allosphingosinicella sp.]